MKPVNVFLMCYNEELLLPHTIKHYRDRFDACNITILDNYSSDNSIEIAKRHGCAIRQWKSSRFNGLDDFKMKRLKSYCWKKGFGMAVPVGPQATPPEGWVVVADMDEWLDASISDLAENESQGVNVLQTQGFQMVGESLREDLQDINLFNITKCYKDKTFSKKVCFNACDIDEVVYHIGAHTARVYAPCVKYSSQAYHLKHMNYLGEPYYIRLMRLRADRIKDQRKKYPAFGAQYTDDTSTAQEQFRKSLSLATEDLRKITQ